MIWLPGCLAALSLFLTLWQWWVAQRFPLHIRQADRSFTPPVTLLKPVKGWDAQAAVAIRSWLAQDYPGPVQILFGINRADDPAAGPLTELIKEHPRIQADLVVCSEVLGVNAKVSNLIQMLRRAEYDVVVVSDADVRVPSDYLVNVVAPLRDASVGLVNSFYRLAEPRTAAMHCEAVAVNSDFWSQVLQGRSLSPQDFALGAVMATRREELARIGGFEALADFLADDFQLGNRIARSGKRIELCPVVVDCLSPPMGWREVWTHQLRWSRTIRVSKPLPYAFSILSNGTLWPLLWLAFFPQLRTLGGFGICLLVRIVTALDQQRRLAPRDSSGLWFWLVPIKDLTQFALWLLAFFGNHIVWRGQRYRLKPDGRLVPEPVS